MTGPSQVNGYAINSNFPVPGQNNTSQGFRDNFHAIRVALNRTGHELSVIQENAVFKNSGTNDYVYGKINRPQLTAYSETFFDMGTRIGSTAIDFSKGNFQKITIDRDIEVRVINVPRGQQISTVKLWVETKTSELKILLPNNFKYGTRTSFVDDNKILMKNPGNYLMSFSATDNGKNYFVQFLSGFTDFSELLITLQQNQDSGTLKIDGLGKIKPAPIDITDLPPASPNDLGLVRVDGTTIGIYDGVISVIGGIPAGNFMNVPSDVRIKKNIRTITDAVDIVNAIRGVRFDYTENDQASMGVIAQEIRECLPELVHANAQGVMTVNYMGMAALFIESIKSLQQQIAQLRAELRKKI